MKENQERIELCVVLENEKGVRVLKQEEASFLYKTILSSKIEYQKRFFRTFLRNGPNFLVQRIPKCN